MDFNQKQTPGLGNLENFKHIKDRNVERNE